MQIKTMIHDICFRMPITKKIYCAASWIKGRVFYSITLARPIYMYKNKNPKPVFLVFTPQHANLGDHAIAYAETQILHKLQIPFFEITGEQLCTLDSYGLLGVLDGAIVLVNGGGNLGTLWPEIENINRKLIIENPTAKILIMPNTFFYGTSEEDKNEFELSKKIYNSHPHLYLYAREMISYEHMKSAYRNVYLAPDLVLSLDYSSLSTKRDGAILCLRHDREATLSAEEFANVKTLIYKLFDGKVKESDTVLNHYVSVDKREEEILDKLKEFSAAELVVTDRLHGMIFCAITGTNCIVLNSKSPKLRGCYEWIKELKYIRFVDEINEIPNVCCQMPVEKNNYNNQKMIKLFDRLEEHILDIYSEY